MTLLEQLLTRRVPPFGAPLVLLSETQIRHPPLASPLILSDRLPLAAPTACPAGP
jgi:hypothetical protein